MDEMHYKECLIELLQDMFGEESVPKIFSGDTITVTVDSKAAQVSLADMKVTVRSSSFWHYGIYGIYGSQRK